MVLLQFVHSLLHCIESLAFSCSRLDTCADLLLDLVHQPVVFREAACCRATIAKVSGQQVALLDDWLLSKSWCAANWSSAVSCMDAANAVLAVWLCEWRETDRVTPQFEYSARSRTRSAWSEFTLVILRLFFAQLIQTLVPEFSRLWWVFEICQSIWSNE